MNSKYLSDDIDLFYVPSSISEYRGRSFIRKCRVLEDMFKNAGVVLDKLKLSVDDYNAYIFIRFDKKYVENLRNRKQEFYDFLQTVMPAYQNIEDWIMEGFELEPKNCTLFVSEKSQQASMVIALHLDSKEFYMPSHETLCLSVDLMAGRIKQAHTVPENWLN
jgi:hypothetical protein